MTKTRKMAALSLVAALTICSLFLVSMGYFKRNGNVRMSVDKEIYHDAENTLMGFLGFKDDSIGVGNYTSKELTGNSGASGSTRLTQRVTVVSDESVLPISGTVTKAQDAYYPGTYELKFSNRAILTKEASVRVSLNVKAGDVVYILTGSKENGYHDYKTVKAVDDNVIAFDTCIIQDYTISTTDIVGAQEAMASVLARP